MWSNKLKRKKNVVRRLYDIVNADENSWASQYLNMVRSQEQVSGEDGIAKMDAVAAYLVGKNKPVKWAGESSFRITGMNEGMHQPEVTHSTIFTPLLSYTYTHAHTYTHIHTHSLIISYSHIHSHAHTPHSSLMLAFTHSYHNSYHHNSRSFPSGELKQSRRALARALFWDSTDTDDAQRARNLYSMLSVYRFIRKDETTYEHR